MQISVDRCIEDSNVITPFEISIDNFMDNVDVTDLWDDKAHDKFQENIVEKSKEKVDNFIENSTYAYRTMRAAMVVAQKIKNECTENHFSGLQTVSDTISWVRRRMFPPEELIDKILSDLTEGNVDGPWVGAPFV